ncbi:peptide MFS transporter [Clostridium rectalis]|uniref:peptide MFS transporter n=1 Tax=Clostridium rectalis TaxID=2040295 RepID=UPI000F62E3E0|nr:peptide MFS transporter [Clostridium rectalis]
MQVKNNEDEMMHKIEKNEASKEKHPPGLYMLFLTEMWERFSYYGMRALLILYLTTEFVRGGLAFDPATAALIYGWYTGLTYITPLIGGYISDRFLGQRKAIVVGATIMALGQFALFAQQTKTFLFIGLFLLVIGNGFFKPNISTLVGKLYSDGDKRKDSAFTIFYMGINVGAFLAPLVCGTLAENIFAVKKAGEIMQYGFKYGFLAAGIGMILSQIIFMALSQKYLGDIGKHTVVDSNGKLKEDNNKPLTLQEKKRTAVIIIITLFVIVFWTGFEQAGSSLTIYTKDFINRDIFGKELAVSWFQSLNPFFIVSLGPIMSILWLKLANRPEGDLSIPKKMSLGMILLGVGFLLMVGAVLQRGNAGDDVTVKANMIWLVGTYFFHTLGELCLSPIGLSMVSKIAPPKYASLLMGVWLSSNGIANILAGYLASYVGSLGALSIFGGIACISILCGLILYSLRNKIEAMMA